MSRTIVLPASLEDELDWDRQKKVAETAASEGQTLFWSLDFGLAEAPFSPYETSHFLSYTIAIDTFVKELWPLYSTRTEGISLYQGDLFFSQRMRRSEKLLHFFDEFLLEFKGDFMQEELYELFCLNLFSEYLHRLASFLPEPLAAYCVLDLSSVRSQARIAQLLSSKRFEHFGLKIEGARIPIRKEGLAPLALCLPPDEKLDSHALSQVDQILEELLSQNRPFRIIDEERLNEEWNELAELIVIEKLLTSQGKRMLMGFEAAGGEILRY